MFHFILSHFFVAVSMLYILIYSVSPIPVVLPVPNGRPVRWMDSKFGKHQILLVESIESPSHFFAFEFAKGTVQSETTKELYNLLNYRMYINLQIDPVLPLLSALSIKNVFF